MNLKIISIAAVVSVALSTAMPVEAQMSVAAQRRTVFVSPKVSNGRPKPRSVQLKRVREGVERYGIVHWGLNTYTDREWGFGDENPRDLDPKNFDADQIVSACKAGGLQGLIIVSKHHDGFCLWPTKTTEHNISKSPFRGGKGNYVKEMEQACRKYGLKFGVYVSPWDRNNAAYGTEKYVTDVFQRQIRELLSGDYGEVFEMWFDGANGGDGYYGGARERRKIPNGYYRYDTETFAMVRKLQPNVCIFNEMDEADFRFGGNEQGIVDPDSRSTGGHYDHIWDNYKQWANTGLVDGTTFHPIEADFPLRPGWFYHAKEKGKTKSAAYLMKCYLTTVGNAATLNIGIAPNRDGVLDEEDVTALKGFGIIREAFFSKPVEQAGEPFNVVVMEEDVANGELVDDWQLLADGEKLLAGKSIGIKRIRVLDKPVAAKKIELKATSKTGAVGTIVCKRYFADPELVKTVLSATTKSGETDTAKWMTVGKESSRTFANPLNLSYRLRPEEGKYFREAADPEIILHRGKYYLFASKCGGYHVSENLMDWQFVASSTLPTEEYAPTVEEIDGVLHYSARLGTVHRAKDLAKGIWEKTEGKMQHSCDSALFRDADNRLYGYWATDFQGKFPIRGCELDPVTFADKTPMSLLAQEGVARYGWLVRGEYNEQTCDPSYIEGPHMIKGNGRYYLQYAAPGTEFSGYCDVALTGPTPLGPFTYQQMNPFSFKPTGYIAGAGHGKTFEEHQGSYLNI